jgi:M6 family metalloprotease-like protein
MDYGQHMAASWRKYRLTSLFGLLALVSFFMWGMSAWPEITRAADYRMQTGSQPERLMGILGVMYGDPPPDSGLPHQDFVLLHQDDGDITQLQMDMGTARSLDGQRVEATGLLSEMVDSPLQATADDSLYVQSIQPIGQAGIPVPTASIGGVQAVTGSHPWVTLLCRFSNSTGSPPHPAEWYQGLLSGIDTYWQTMSYDVANIDDPDLPDYNVKGWYTLPQPRSYYMSGSNPNFDRIMKDCTAQADAVVFFPDYTGINLMLDQNIGCCAWGGRWTLTRDGTTRAYSATWMPPGWAQSHWVLGHEMGHGFGLPHSSGPYGQVYDSDWDIMSGGGLCALSDPEYGCTGVGTIAYHLDMLGWIQPSRKHIVNVNNQTIIVLERLRTPLSVSNYLMAQVPINGSSSSFYTVETRHFESYDQSVPGMGVLIHNVLTSRREPANVVDADDNGNVNDQGAMWSLGETFDSPTGSIRVTVTDFGASSYTVFIANGRATLNAPGDGTLTGDSTPQFSWSTLNGATSDTFQIARDAAFTTGLQTFTGLVSQTYTPAALAEGVWYWRVRAMTGTTPGHWSAPRSLTIDLTPPLVPTIINPASGSTVVNYFPTFSWNSDPDVVAYEIRLENKNPPGDLFSTAANSLMVNFPLVADTTYYWQVRARDAAGNWSNWTGLSDVTINSPATAVPAQAYYQTDTPVLTWGQISWATGYAIEIDDDWDMSSPFDTPSVDASTLQYTTPALRDGVYYWRVRALDNGAWSAIQSFTVDAP